MTPLAGRRVLVVGRDPSGEAVTRLLRSRGAEVNWQGAEEDGTGMVGSERPDLVVLSAGCEGVPPVARHWTEAGVPLSGEREIAFQQSLCLHVGVVGASGKSTTARLIAEVLQSAGRRVGLASGWEQPASAWVEESRDLDWMVHAVGTAELEHLRYFRPVVGVLLNAAGEESGGDDAVRRLALLVQRQQAFDWTIVQSEALARMQATGLRPPGKVITFSASSRQADLGVDRGLLVSRLEGWTGRLWDMARGPMQGLHFAEDLLAALAVGRVLRLTLDEMTPALDAFRPGPGRMEFLGERDGVRYIDDSRCTQRESLERALLALAPVAGEQPNLWLIAGGESGGRQYYDLGPVLSPRVKQALVYGEAAGPMRSAWSLFTPCSVVGSLLEATERVVSQATRGDVVLFSPACPRSGKGEAAWVEANAFRRVVLRHLEAGIGGGATAAEPEVRGGGAASMQPPRILERVTRGAHAAIG